MLSANMAEGKTENGCPRCAELEARVAALEVLVASLQAALAKAQKHSGNSSKPPSSDIVKPRRKTGKQGRRKKPGIGGQPGHDRHERTPFSSDQIDKDWFWYYSECPCCRGDLRRLFSVIHRREEYASPENFQRALEEARRQLVWDAIQRAPLSREASNLARRFRENADNYFRFITEPNVEPTNNLAEQGIRFVAIHRRVTQGTRCENGRNWCERIWTVIQTCSQQSRSVFDFLCVAVTA